MTPADNGNERVTMRTLDSKIELSDARQRVEHIKTRALVFILAIPSFGKALPYVLGYFGWKL